MHVKLQKLGFMKKVIFCFISVFLFATTSLYSAYYVTTSFMKIGECDIIHINVFDDNGTPDNPRDDHKLGSGFYKYCPHDPKILENSSVSPMYDFNPNGELKNSQSEFSDLNIFPNPILKGNLYADLGDNKITHIQVINISGQILKSIQGNFSGIIQLPLNDLQAGPGIYFLKLTDSFGVTYTKSFIYQ
jgi:hypothetical protein